MRQVTLDDLAALRESHEAPCISLYQPTHRHHPDSEQDPIRFRNLRRRLELSLKQKMKKLQQLEAGRQAETAISMKQK